MCCVGCVVWLCGVLYVGCVCGCGWAVYGFAIGSVVHWCGIVCVVRCVYSVGCVLLHFSGIRAFSFGWCGWFGMEWHVRVCVVAFVLAWLLVAFVVCVMCVLFCAVYGMCESLFFSVCSWCVGLICCLWCVSVLRFGVYYGWCG